MLVAAPLASIWLGSSAVFVVVGSVATNRAVFVRVMKDPNFGRAGRPTPVYDTMIVTSAC